MRNKFQFVQKNFIIVMGGIIMLWGISGCSANRPENVGLKNNLLLPCPESPNCVLSQESDSKHQIQPIHYNVSLEAAKERIKFVT